MTAGPAITFLLFTVVASSLAWMSQGEARGWFASRMIWPQRNAIIS
jgi:hypothetical protein